MHRIFVLSLLLLSVPGDARELVTYERDGQRLEIELSSKVAASQRDDAIEWIRGTADALAMVYGRWPLDRWRVRVTTYAGGGSDRLCVRGAVRAAGAIVDGILLIVDRATAGIGHKRAGHVTCAQLLHLDLVSQDGCIVRAKVWRLPIDFGRRDTSVLEINLLTVYLVG